jgi:hypothetical protein
VRKQPAYYTAGFIILVALLACGAAVGAHQPASITPKVTNAAIMPGQQKSPSQKLDPKTMATPNQEAIPTAPSPNSEPTAQESTASMAACDETVSAIKRDYNADTTKAKRSLDDKLTFHVSLNISSRYVDDYNTDMKRIYAEHQAEADTKHCVFDVLQPVELAPTYPY